MNTLFEPFYVIFKKSSAKKSTTVEEKKEQEKKEDVKIDEEKKVEEKTKSSTLKVRCILNFYLSYFIIVDLKFVTAKEINKLCCMKK